jgi:hypothetical protein
LLKSQVTRELVRKLPVREQDAGVGTVRGGVRVPTVIVLADKRVNHRKGNRTPDEAGLKLIKSPNPPRELPATAFIRNTHGIRDWEMFLG